MMVQCYLRDGPHRGQWMDLENPHPTLGIPPAWLECPEDLDPKNLSFYVWVASIGNRLRVYEYRGPRPELVRTA